MRAVFRHFMGSLGYPQRRDFSFTYRYLTPPKEPISWLPLCYTPISHHHELSTPSRTLWYLGQPNIGGSGLWK